MWNCDTVADKHIPFSAKNGGLFLSDTGREAARWLAMTGNGTFAIVSSGATKQFHVLQTPHAGKKIVFRLLPFQKPGHYPNRSVGHTDKFLEC